MDNNYIVAVLVLGCYEACSFENCFKYSALFGVYFNELRLKNVYFYYTIITL